MTPSFDLKPLLVDGLAALRLSPKSETIDQLLEYVALLARWNATYNLTSVRDPRDMLVRHILDSLAIAPYLRGANLADVGSGPGLPGIPLALLFPEREFVLIDANGKMARFMREAVRALGLSKVRIEQQRVEAVQGSFDCVTARAFASLADMLALGGQLLAADGIWLALKGRYPEDEISALPVGFELAGSERLQVPGLDAERHLIIVRKTTIAA
ncbi:16S rRNA (guanine(527)-N(7))-methyltransferase RsmG [Pseudolysobacter antarcticus]|uniref:Ribosomal RNA small subunit methyltransferase G n=1 Tax=Pseudolysobacter antarcticus TaxID=2511995 RepID=A0A411HP56_9GAMM|nr:16S rRNA (guanine(527)-N(7))-methyltransferase RsmG [Pseudolysobacter antarcticus]QBB72265.1 16S rRNA (guanine(527)-N(7))-methyltransferase RsmG [Pseudolysobacter antarcticus]